MIEIKNLTKSYGEKLVYKNFDLCIPSNKIVSIMGASGSGKTTLLNILAGLTFYEEGSINGISDNKSYIFQETRLLPWLNAKENIEYVLKSQNKVLYDDIDRYLEIVKMIDYKYYMPNELSGGMKQRISLIRGFIYPADIVFMDEAFKALDVKLKMEMIKILINIWNLNKKSVIFITHDIDEALLVSDYIVVIGNEPAKKKYEVSIKISKKNRDIHNDYFQDLRNKIYKYIT